MSKRKRQTPEQIFLDSVNNMVRNFFIKNPNFSNGYYYDEGMMKSDIIKDVNRSAEYILEKIEDMKHLIIYEEDEE